jgi:hypothetical protein
MKKTSLPFQEILPEALQAYLYIVQTSQKAQEEIVLEMIAVLVSGQLSHPPFPAEE